LGGCTFWGTDSEVSVTTLKRVNKQIKNSKKRGESGTHGNSGKLVKKGVSDVVLLKRHL